MFRWLTDEPVAACDDAAELGVANSELSDLPQQLVDVKANKSAPLIQAAYSIEREYLEAFLLTPQNACTELPESHPLRVAMVALDSHARTSGASDDYFWLLKRFGAFSAPTQLDVRSGALICRVLRALFWEPFCRFGLGGEHPRGDISG